MKKLKPKWDKFLSFVPMNKTVEHYISELLFLHDCVILPNFGGFVGNPQSAKLNRTTAVLSPPSKQILFNANLKTNDGLLIIHISTQEGITQEVAKTEVEKYAAKITDKLSNSKILRIDKIGLFTVGKEENIIFLQDSSNNYSLDSFGMTATQNKAVLREAIIEKKVAATIQNIRTQNNNPKAFLRAAAVIIPLIALSYISITQQDKINNVYTQMASLNPFESSIITEPIAAVIPEVKIEVEATPIVEVIEEEITPIIIPQKTYYIIAGAFSEKKNANKMLAKLKKWNYNTEIVRGENLLRVSYNSFTNKTDALISLYEIKQENSDAWLLTQ
ncbi:MAG: HU-CCDC81 and SPOR domain-containing protein [Flavobacteriales bacterium]|nr:HU-CCDC81 and SPOR domain-containing protein [Flavobacteriales bacterium]